MNSLSILIFISLLLEGTYGFYLQFSHCTYCEESRLAMQNPDLFEGDIMGIDPKAKMTEVFIPDNQTRWPDKQVPYVIDESLKYRREQILSAMDNYQQNTCIRFVPRTTQKNYIKLFSGEGCYSDIGMADKGEQLLSLGKGCYFKGTIIHELGHALGFFHEHNRSDRDRYLVIYWQNIEEGLKSQFALLEPSKVIANFDLDSIMMYGNYAFTKSSGIKTMATRSGKVLLEAYDKQGLSKSDIGRINTMYNC